MSKLLELLRQAKPDWQQAMPPGLVVQEGEQDANRGKSIVGLWHRIRHKSGASHRISCGVFCIL